MIKEMLWDNVYNYDGAWTTMLSQCWSSRAKWM